MRGCDNEIGGWNPPKRSVMLSSRLLITHLQLSLDCVGISSRSLAERTEVGVKRENAPLASYRSLLK